MSEYMVHKRHSADFMREAVKLALTSGLPREDMMLLAHIRAELERAVPGLAA